MTWDETLLRSVFPRLGFVMKHGGSKGIRKVEVGDSPPSLRILSSLPQCERKGNFILNLIFIVLRNVCTWICCSSNLSPPHISLRSSFVPFLLIGFLCSPHNFNSALMLCILCDCIKSRNYKREKTYMWFSETILICLMQLSPVPLLSWRHWLHSSW